MATKRMFSLKIVDTDAFVEMPNEAQLLYFRLCLSADDDGFVSNPRRVMRSYGIADDNMKILIAKKFILLLKRDETAILLVKHWRMHNTIQKDRYTPSPYHDLLRYIYLDENNAYSLNNGEGKRPALIGEKSSNNAMFPFCIQDVYTDKISIDKDRLGEDRLEKDNNISLSEKENKKEKENEVSNNLSNKADEIAKRYGIPREELP